jgi:hypothetical protein
MDEAAGLSRVVPALLVHGSHGAADAGLLDGLTAA